MAAITNQNIIHVNRSDLAKGLPYDEPSMADLRKQHRAGANTFPIVRVETPALCTS